MTALRITTIAISIALLTGGSALAGPPIATDDADTVDVGNVEIELNGSYTHDKEKTAGITAKNSSSDAEMKVTAGLYKNLGISLAIPYTVRQRTKENDLLMDKADGFCDMTFEIKYAFAELAGINFAVKPAVIIPTGNYDAGLSDDRWQFGGTLIATKEFSDGKYAIHSNIEYEHRSCRTVETKENNRSDFLSWSVAGETEVAQGLFAVADFGIATTVDKSVSKPSVYALTGARYEINDYLDVNVGIKFGLFRPEEGLTALYGMVLKF